MCLPCCFPFADVYLEDPPKKKEEKKEEEKKEFIFVNDDAVFVPTSAYHPHPPLAYAAYPTAVVHPPAPTHNPWPSKTRAQIDAENLALAHRNAATKPVQLVPYDPRPDQQFWCRELDSSYTLRSSKEVTEECQPGYWQYAQGGYPFWVRGEGK